MFQAVAKIVATSRAGGLRADYRDRIQEQAALFMTEELIALLKESAGDLDEAAKHEIGRHEE